MIDYSKAADERREFGAFRLKPDVWALRINDITVATLTLAELDRLAAGLAFRLDVTDVVATPVGVQGLVADNASVHLCYSDQAEDFARSVMAAAGRNGVTY